MVPATKYLKFLKFKLIFVSFNYINFYLSEGEIKYIKVDI